MSNDRILRQIKARLSLRPPQADSLDILDDILDRIAFDKLPTRRRHLQPFEAAWPSGHGFRTRFPVAVFRPRDRRRQNAADGRVYQLSVSQQPSRNFFVLAPNTTIYDKLIADFTPNTEKYVFKGIAEFAQMPPILVTGDTWDQGRGVRGGDLFGSETAIVNIFNVDKINKDAGRIKKLHEYIGQSYFDYLAELPDLVLLMDEAHRYRARPAGKRLANCIQ